MQAYRVLTRAALKAPSSDVRALSLLVSATRRCFSKDSPIEESEPQGFKDFQASFAYKFKNYRSNDQVL